MDKIRNSRKRDEDKEEVKGIQERQCALSGKQAFNDIPEKSPLPPGKFIYQ